MEYLTYDDYKSIGGVLDSIAFNRFSVRAFSIIKQETNGRIDKMSAVPEEVKHLCRDLVEYLSNNSTTDRTISSESQSQGGASESVSYADKGTNDIVTEIWNLIYDYLASVTDDNGTPLIYRGCLNA